MRRLIKKNVVAVLMTGVLFTSSSLLPNRANALFAAASYGQPLSMLLFGSACAGAAAGAFSLMARAWRSSGVESFSLFVMGTLSLFGAWILLDTPEHSVGEFRSLDAKQAGALGLTAQEWRSYEEELPLINALREEVLARTQKQYPNPELVNDQTLIDHVRAEWKSLSERALSSESVHAVEKISVAQVRALQNG